MWSAITSDGLALQSKVHEDRSMIRRGCVAAAARLVANRVDLHMAGGRVLDRADEGVGDEDMVDQLAATPGRPGTIARPRQ